MEIIITNLVAILSLVILEGLLSFDNALALAALVKKRLKDPKDQARALTYGMAGAYFFRILMVFIGVWLISFPETKLAAGGYLLWLAYSELFKGKGMKEDGENEVGGLDLTSWLSKFKWITNPALVSTIIAVEIMDLAFSLDSIGVALAISNEKWVLITGAILGILMMRIAAKYFVSLLDRFPILEPTAFILVGMAGTNVVLKGIQEALAKYFETKVHIEVPEAIFLPALLIVFVGSMFLNDRLYPKKSSEEKDKQAG